MFLTYNQIISLNRQFVSAHHVLKNFGNGDEPEMVLHNQEAAYKYPLLWAQDLPGLIQPGRENTSFRLWFLAPVEMLDSTDAEVINANITEVKSDMKRCAQDLLSYWHQQHEYPKFHIEQTTSINFVENTTLDSLYGCYVDVNFYQAFTWNTCAIPMGTPEPLPPSCAPAFVYANDTLVFQVASGAEYMFDIVDANGNVVGVWDSVLQKFTVPAGGSSFDITVNDDPFYTAVMGNQNVPVKNSALQDVGSKIGANWRIGDTSAVIKNTNNDVLLTANVAAEQMSDFTVGDCEQTFNGDPVESQPAETTKTILVHNEDDEIVGTVLADTEDELDVLIGNAEVEINDSAGGNLYTLSVKPEAAVPQVITDGSVILKNAFGETFETYTNKAQEAKVITLPIIYFRPQSSGFKVSFLTGDEYYNEVNFPPPSSPTIGIPAFLDPTDPKKLLNNNAFGNKQRFTGLNGGYWDYATSQYKLADGTVSDQATTFGVAASNTSYFIDNHTGAAYKWNVQGSTTFSTQVTNILALTHNGYSDYFLPSVFQYRSLYCFMNLGSSLTSLIPFNSGNTLKTSTPSLGNETTQHHQIIGVNVATARADATNDNAYAMRWHF